MKALNLLLRIRPAELHYLRPAIKLDHRIWQLFRTTVPRSEYRGLRNPTLDLFGKAAPEMKEYGSEMNVVRLFLLTRDSSA